MCRSRLAKALSTYPRVVRYQPLLLYSRCLCFLLRALSILSHSSLKFYGQPIPTIGTDGKDPFLLLVVGILHLHGQAPYPTPPYYFKGKVKGKVRAIPAI